MKFVIATSFSKVEQLAPLAIAAEDYSDDKVRRAAKRLLRQALAPQLGQHQLFTRELFEVKA